MGLAGYGPVPEPGYYFKIYANLIIKILNLHIPSVTDGSSGVIIVIFHQWILWHWYLCVPFAQDSFSVTTISISITQ